MLSNRVVPISITKGWEVDMLDKNDVLICDGRPMDQREFACFVEKEEYRNLTPFELVRKFVLGTAGAMRGWIGKEPGMLRPYRAYLNTLAGKVLERLGKNAQDVDITGGESFRQKDIAIAAEARGELPDEVLVRSVAASADCIGGHMMDSKDPVKDFCRGSKRDLHRLALELVRRLEARQAVSA